MARLRPQVAAASRKALWLMGGFAAASIFLALLLGFVISWSFILPVREAEGFLAHEAEERMSPPYPPETSLLNVVVSAEQETRATEEALAVADWLGKLIETQGLPLVLLGPAVLTTLRRAARRARIVR